MTEGVDADAARVMELTKQELSSLSGVCGNCDQLFPHNKLDIQDVTHATRRLLLRPFSAHREMAEAVNTLILERESISQRIKNSEGMQDVWNECMSEAALELDFEVNSFLSGPGVAKHRFDSVNIPLIVFVLCFKVKISFARKIKVLMKDQQVAKDAVKFLYYIEGDIGAKHCLIIAFLADATTLCMILLRYTFL